MGYKRKNDWGKEGNRACGKVYLCSRQKITKQKVGENRCNDISFRPLSDIFLREKVGVNRIEFLPKYGICACF